MPRVAAIDCGTNSLRLLIADVDPTNGVLVDVEREMIVVRLGQGVDRTGRLADDALERAFSTTSDYAQRCRAMGVEALRFVATSASRDASNSEVFVQGVLERIGVEPEIICGEEEASLSFLGATAALAAHHPAPYLVVDLGGGSTELVLGGDAPQAVHSMNVGCVRLTERRLHSDPPTPDQVAAAIDDIHQALDRAAADVPLHQTATLVGLAGSVTTVTAHALRLERYLPDVIDGTILGMHQATLAASDLLAMTRKQRKSLGFMHPGRIDVIGAGALIWRETMHRVRDAVRGDGRELPTVVTSEHDMLDGIAWRLATQLDSRPR
jgi:exopolyphosphatase/guanosine-5'-triphosphate,3'-diphosphate pyrophosphatase